MAIVDDQRPGLAGGAARCWVSSEQVPLSRETEPATKSCLAECFGVWHSLNPRLAIGNWQLAIVGFNPASAPPRRAAAWPQKEPSLVARIDRRHRAARRWPGDGGRCANASWPRGDGIG